MVYQAAERYGRKEPNATESQFGDLAINDTGGDLRVGDIVQIRGNNATSGVSTTDLSGTASWMYRASLPDSANERFKYGKFRVVTQDAVDGEEVKLAGRETHIAKVLITAAAGTTIPVESGVIPVDGAKGGTATIAGPSVKIIARTLEEVTVATGESAVLALCEVNGEFGFGAA